MSTPATHSPSARGNAEALRKIWQPVAFAETLGEAPIPADLLGEPLVIWRDSTGTAKAM